MGAVLRSCVSVSGVDRWFLPVSTYQPAVLAWSISMRCRNARLNSWWIVNSAPWQEFANLPGIGEKLAREIVQHRTQVGGFANANQLVDVHGIGEHEA